VYIKAGVGSVEAFARALGKHEYTLDQVYYSTILRTNTQEPYPCTHNVTGDEQVRNNRMQQEHPSPDIECVMPVVRE
jgi:phosphohistidine phosphatase SixA